MLFERVAHRHLRSYSSACMVLQQCSSCLQGDAQAAAPHQTMQQHSSQPAFHPLNKKHSAQHANQPADAAALAQHPAEPAGVQVRHADISQQHAEPAEFEKLTQALREAEQRASAAELAVATVQRSHTEAVEQSTRLQVGVLCYPNPTFLGTCVQM